MISAESVKDLLATAGIKKASIIDDAFDPPESSMGHSEVVTFMTEYLTLPDVQEALALLDIEINGPDDFDEDVFHKITHSNDERLKETAGFLRHTAESKRQALDGFAGQLEESLALNVAKIGACVARDTTDAPVGEDVGLIFLDYELEAGTGNGNFSATILERIYTLFKERNDVPLVILMSNLNLDEGKISDFQMRTKLLSGMFYFVPKESLFNPEMLHYRLASFAKAIPTGRALQRFVQNIEDSIEKARSEVFNDLRALSIADYAYLQTMRLHDDGQPMGEYLTWLFTSHLGQKITEDANHQAVESSVNALRFESLPPTQTKPSGHLARLYSSAVLRKVPPLASVSDTSGASLQFGDLFRKTGTKKVWLCINAPCDLAFSDTRPLRKKRSILLLPGELLEIEKQMKSADQRKPRTEMVRLDANKTHRIVWDTKEVARCDWSKLVEWQTAEKCTRVARLHTPFALEIQRSFAADLSRIGMPVPPPVYSEVVAELYCLDEHDEPVLLTDEGATSAIITGSDRGERLVLGEVFMDSLPSMLETAKGHLEKRIEAVKARTPEEPEALAEINKALDVLKLSIEDAGILASLRGPFDMPEVGKRKLFKELISVSRAPGSVAAPECNALSLSVRDAVGDELE